MGRSGDAGGDQPAERGALQPSKAGTVRDALPGGVLTRFVQIIDSTGFLAE